MTELILAVAFAIGVSFLCSLAEAVLYTVPVSHIESLADSGHGSGRILRNLRRDIDSPISAILTLNTVSHTVGAAVAGAAAAELFGHRWLGLFSGLLTFAILVFSEIIPKTAGVVFNRKLAPYIAHPLRVLIVLLWPFVWMSRGITRWITGSTRSLTVTAEDIRVLARIGRDEGVIENGEANVIQNILAQAEVEVRQIMTPRTVAFTLHTATTMARIRDEIGIPTYSRIPVHVDDPEEIVGIALQRDILAAIVEGRGESTLEEIMRPVHFVAESFRLDEVLRQFLARREHLFVVIDEYGGFAGVVTLEDALEQILGAEIVDELDEVVSMRELARRRRSGIAPSDSS